MLKDLTNKFYLNDNVNCAESMLLGANEIYNLNLNNDDIMLVSAFGGGLGCGLTCGALCGALSVLGKVYKTKTYATKEGMKDISTAFVKDFKESLGDIGCDILKEKYRRDDTKCAEVVKITSELLEKHISKINNAEDFNTVKVSSDDIKKVKALGFLHCKGTNNFNCRVITRNGKITNEESACITEGAKKFGNGEIAMTTRLTMEIQNVPYENIDLLRAFLLKSGLKTGGTGSKVRPIVSCKGTTCQYGLYDTFHLSNVIHTKFFEGYSNVKLPHKFKIAIGGCPNNCVKPDLNDFGIVGAKTPSINNDLCKGCKKCIIETSCPMSAAKVIDNKLNIDENICNHCGRCIGKCPFKSVENGANGYKVYIGGRWGKKVAAGRKLNKIFLSEEEVLSVLEKAILLFREQGVTGERFADTINRLGFENVEIQLLSNDILDRKEEILDSKVHLTGGATC